MWNLAQSQFGMETIISVVSFVLTIYYWFVQASREKADLHIFQLMDFHAVCRRVPGREGVRRLCVQQVDSCGVLIANNSTRQNSIVLFECSFRHEGRAIHGDWGYVENDKPPWNIGPESSIALGLACFFDVPEDFEVPDDLLFRVAFVMVNGRRFTHDFSLKAPNLTSNTYPEHIAA